MQWLGRAMNHALSRAASARPSSARPRATPARRRSRLSPGSRQVEVFILYPHGRVSDVQRRQMTTVDRPNVHALAIEGTFDDCQAIVKGLFGDLPFRDALALSGVNSINWARVLAQIVYYFTTAVSLGAPDRKVVSPCRAAISATCWPAITPSGWACRSSGWSIATNENDILARTLASGRYEAEGVRRRNRPRWTSRSPRISNACCSRPIARTRADPRTDGDFARKRAASPSIPRRSAPFAPISTRSGSTRPQFAEMGRVYKESAIVLDPHSAVGVRAARLALEADSATPVIALGTAHPAKFPDAVERATGVRPALPPHLGDDDDAQGANSPSCPTTGRRRKLIDRIAPSRPRSGRRHERRSHNSAVRPPGRHRRDGASRDRLARGLGRRRFAPRAAPTSTACRTSSNIWRSRARARRSAREIAEEIEVAGGDLNAATSVEQTAYYARVLGGDVGLASRRAGRHPDREPVRRAGTRAREERHPAGDRRGRGHARRSRFRSLQCRRLSRTSRSAGRSSARRERVKAFDRATIVAYLGALPPRRHRRRRRRRRRSRRRWLRLSEKRFAGLPVAKVEAVGAGALSRRRERDRKRRLEQAHIIIGFEGVSYADPAHDAVQVFANAVGGGMSSRLFQEMREKRGLVLLDLRLPLGAIPTAACSASMPATVRNRAAELMQVALDSLAAAARTSARRKCARQGADEGRPC